MLEYSEVNFIVGWASFRYLSNFLNSDVGPGHMHKISSMNLFQRAGSIG